MQKKLIKSLAITLCLSMLGTGLVGCSKGTEGTVTPEATTEAPKTEAPKEEAKQEEPKKEEAAEGAKEFANKELNVALFQGGYGDEFWKQVISMFETAYPGVKVNATINPKIGEIIRPQIVAGNAPDFIYLNETSQDGLILSLIKEKALLDITDVFDGQSLDHDSTLRDMVIPGYLESTHYAPYGDEKIYLAPFNSGPMGLIYNATLFEEKGWDVPKTWDQFFALGDAAKAEGIALFTYQGIYPGYLESMFFPAIGGAGGLGALDKIYNYEEGAMKTPEVKTVLDNFQKLSTDGYLMNGTVALNHTQSQTDMMMGKALFIPNGVWMEAEMKDSPRADGFKFAMAPAPVVNEGDTQYIQSSFEQFSIPAAAKNPELAKEFLRFLYTDEVVSLFAEKAGGVFALNNALELAKPYLSEDTYSMYGVYEKGEAMLTAFKSLPAGSKVIVYDEVFTNAVTPVMNGEMTTDQWADQVEAAFAQIRKEYEAAK